MLDRPRAAVSREFAALRSRLPDELAVGGADAFGLPLLVRR
ncbi:hypothetical protein [Streptomyces sp. NPDC014734]